VSEFQRERERDREREGGAEAKRREIIIIIGTLLNKHRSFTLSSSCDHSSTSSLHKRKHIPLSDLHTN
jgi:hypothetical protein